MNFVHLMSPVQQSFEAVLKLFCISFEAVYVSCVLDVVATTRGSAGTPSYPYLEGPHQLAKGCCLWFRANTLGLRGQK